MRIIFLFISLQFCHVASAQNCNEIKQGRYGVPAKYLKEKCNGDIEFNKKNYSEASKHYEIASKEIFFESPNYRVRLNLAEALCLNGKKEQGLIKLKSFEMMARADLGLYKCPNEYNGTSKSDYIHLACEGSGSVLSEKGKVVLKAMLGKSKKVKDLCK